VSTAWVNGSFDILHVGHLKLLEFASTHGDLIVGIDSDRRISHLKGIGRPYNSEINRKFFLECLKFVKEVHIFDSDYELEQLIKKISPNHLIVGDDYINKKIIGSDYSDKIIFFKKIIGFSTTSILNYKDKLI